MTFHDYLGRLEDALDIPYPGRKDVVNEIGTHLDDLYADLRKDGLSAGQARAQAIQAMSADAAFLHAMSEVHCTTIANALSRLPISVSLGIEYASIAVVGLFLVFTTILKEAPMIEFLASGGFFMIPINVAGIAILFLGIERVYSLFIKKDHSQGNLRKRLLSLNFLAVVCILSGVIGTLVGFYEAFSMAEQIAARFDGRFPIFEVARIAMTTSIWGMTLALVAVIFRFVAQSKSSRILEIRSS